MHHAFLELVGRKGRMYDISGENLVIGKRLYWEIIQGKFDFY